jgi:hypothetical protein
VRLLPRQRVEIGDEVSADPVHVDERLHVDLLLEHRLFVVDRVVVPPPADGLVGDTEGPEALLVEPLLPEQEVVDVPEEQARLGTLDDPVVVRGGDRHDLRDPEVGQRLGVGPLEGGRDVEPPDADDHALARHESGHRLDGADRAGVGERDGGAGEVVR